MSQSLDGESGGGPIVGVPGRGGPRLSRTSSSSSLLVLHVMVVLTLGLSIGGTQRGKSPLITQPKTGCCRGRLKPSAQAESAEGGRSGGRKRLCLEKHPLSMWGTKFAPSPAPPLL